MQVLAKLPWLRSLNLRGCSISARPGYPAAVLRLLPGLEVLDNKRLGNKQKHGKVAQHSSVEPAEQAVAAAETPAPAEEGPPPQKRKAHLPQHLSAEPAPALPETQAALPDAGEAPPSARPVPVVGVFEGKAKKKKGSMATGAKAAALLAAGAASSIGSGRSWDEAYPAPAVKKQRRG